MFAFIENWRKEKQAWRACIKHARMHGLEKEFKEAYFYNRDIIAALEEWDLFDESIREKLKSIYNSVN